MTQEAWLPISTAPTLERVFVAGWQDRRDPAPAYWWFHEDATDDHGVPMERPDALLWQPMPDAPIYHPSHYAAKEPAK